MKTKNAGPHQRSFTLLSYAICSPPTSHTPPHTHTFLVFCWCHVCLSLAHPLWRVAMSVAVSLVCASTFTPPPACSLLFFPACPSSDLWVTQSWSQASCVTTAPIIHCLCATAQSLAAALCPTVMQSHAHVFLRVHTCSHTSPPCKSPYSLLLTYVTCPLLTCHWIRKLRLTGALL